MSGSRWWVIPAAVIVAFGIVAITTTANRPAVAEDAQHAEVAPPTVAARYAPVESCADCHEDKWEQLKRTTHGKAEDKRTPAAKQACQTCHGPMAEHVDAGGGKETVNRSFGKDSKLSAEEKSATCLQCHEKGKPAMWSGSKHQGMGLACMDCHSVHKGNPKNLVSAVQHEVCFQCHKDKKAEVKRASHHPILEGKVNCADCHNPHGTPTKHMISANSTNEKCYQCHAEKRGPYLFEHRPVAENCATCHNAHGSNHTKLMKNKLPFLCQSCHSASGHPGTPYAVNPAVGGNTIWEKIGNVHDVDRACVNCHSNIHGSNHPAGQRLLR